MENNMINHEQYREWVQLASLGELNSEEQGMLDRHLSECDSCRNEFRELRKFYSLMAAVKDSEPDEELLLEARRELRAAIRIENSRTGVWERAVEAVRDFFMVNYKIALGGAGVLLIGFLLGYLMKRPVESGMEQALTAHKQTENKAVKGTDQITDNNIKIDNLRFQDSDASDGEVSFTFDAVKPVHMKGKINDEAIQKVLAHALVNEQNDGVRLRTISAIAAQTENEKKADPKVKAALITTLKHDKNPGVRREALLVLQKFPMEKDIEDAFLFVLSNDTNSGLRIAAINSLTPEKIEEKKVDQELINVLKQKSQTDNNEYVRIRAKSVLQEVANNATL